MGKKRNRKNKDTKTDQLGGFEPQASQVTETTSEIPDKTKPTRQPIMIPMKTFQVIYEYMLQVSPIHRNIFLSVNEFPIDEINPMHVKTEDSPTHMILFCLRLMLADQFHPIGVVQIDKRMDQVDKLVMVWKAFIQDLSILRLIVVGSISPPTLLFHDVLSELTKNPNLEEFNGPITYSVWPYQEILHIYDLHSLMKEFQDSFAERVDLYFINPPPKDKNESSRLDNLQLFSACWTDVLLSIAWDEKKYKMYRSDEEITLCVGIFSPEFVKMFKTFCKKGASFAQSGPSTERLLQALEAVIELSLKSEYLTLADLEAFYEKNEDLLICLASAHFAWFNLDASTTGNTISELKKTISEKMSNIESANANMKLPLDSYGNTILSMDQISVKSDNSIELDDNEVDNIIGIIDKSLETDSKPLKQPFNHFTQKNNNYNTFTEACPKVFVRPTEEEKIIPDSKYLESEVGKSCPLETSAQSRIASTVKEFLVGLKKDLTESLKNGKTLNATKSKGSKYALTTAESLTTLKAVDELLEGKFKHHETLSGLQMLPTAGLEDIHSKRTPKFRKTRKKILKEHSSLSSCDNDNSEAGLVTSNSSSNICNNTNNRMTVTSDSSPTIRGCKTNGTESQSKDNESQRSQQIITNELTQIKISNPILDSSSIDESSQDQNSSMLKKLSDIRDRLHTNIFLGQNCFSDLINIESTLYFYKTRGNKCLGFPKIQEEISENNSNGSNSTEKGSRLNYTLSKLAKVNSLIPTSDSEKINMRYDANEKPFNGSSSLGSHDRTLDALDLAIGDISHLTESIIETAIQDFSAILVSYSKALGIPYSPESSKSDSSDGLVVGDDRRFKHTTPTTHFAKKLMALSSKMKNTQTQRCSSSDSELFVSNNSKQIFDLRTLKRNLEICQKRNRFISNRSGTKSAIEELEMLVDKVNGDGQTEGNHKSVMKDVIELNNRTRDKGLEDEIRASSASETLKRPLPNERDASGTANVKSGLTNSKKLKCHGLRNPSPEVTSFLLPCCNMPSTSQTHSPSCEVENRYSLPHYTRFYRSYSPSNSDDEGCTSLSHTVKTKSDNNNSLLQQVHAAGITVENNNSQEPEKMEIDYCEYRKGLVSTLRDQKKPSCDIFNNMDKCNELFDEMPHESETLRVTTDWLCTLKGYRRLKETLERRHVPYIRSSLFSLDHTNFFIAVLKKFEHNIDIWTMYAGSAYYILNSSVAYDMLKSGDGLFILTRDEERI